MIERDEALQDHFKSINKFSTVLTFLELCNLEEKEGNSF